MIRSKHFRIPLAVACFTVILVSGCARHKDEVACPPRPSPPPPLGTLSDPVWQAQERNAEASDFVIHQHEFQGNTARLNPAGEAHVKQLAVRAARMPEFPIQIEPSMTTRREGDEYGYPIHKNPELDKKRRELVVHALTAMGLTDAERRVVTAPATAPGYEHFEAERAYYRGFNNNFGAFGNNFNNGGFGTGFGGGLGFF